MFFINKIPKQGPELVLFIYKIRIHESEEKGQEAEALAEVEFQASYTFLCQSLCSNLNLSSGFEYFKNEVCMGA